MTVAAATPSLSPRQRAWRRFRRNRRGYVSLWIFSILFGLSLFAEVLCNDEPIVVHYEDELYFPLFLTYPETAFGGVFETAPDYASPFMQQRLNADGNWAIFPPVPHGFDTIAYHTESSFPAPPSGDHILGTDDRGRDILARLVYGFRLSVVFALALTAVATGIGVVLGALQGYWGGRFDLLFQRFTEVWNALPELYLLIIFASIFKPSIWLLLILLALFGWMGMSDYVRAEFLRARNMEYVTAARALGVGDAAIMGRHLLPNGMTPVITFLPFRISGAVIALTSLDFLGLGVPPSTPSLGELLAQGKENLDAWWISLSTFGVLVGMLMLLIFIGEGLRAANDRRAG
ncbi:MAG: ABC transporter permease [Halofilum sp. (in: g-proteobacteria)]